MGGEIGINSEEGKGSTFWISLKMDLTEQARNFTEGHHLLDDKHIAIFDENHHALTGLRNVLENWGARLTSYQQLEQLKSTIINQKTEHYDLLLIAINLAANKAKKQCELVKLIQQDYDSPLIILDNTKHYGEHQLAGNVNCWFITKPLVRHKLQQLLEKFLLQRVDGQVIADNPAQYNKKQAMPKILAVDDNPANLKLLCALLADLRLEVHTAETGVQAVTYTEKQNFDLIFMDIQMPDMDGIEATSRIRLQEKKGQHTPIVALTAHALLGEKENLLNSGMDDYITKPITQQVLVSMLTKWTQYDTRQSVDHQPEQHKTIDQSLAVFDQKASLKLVAGKESLAKEMLTMLLAELEQERQAINSAYKDNDRAVMLEKTHRLHGASRYTGAISLQHALANLEKALKQHQTDINLQLAALNKETSKVYLWIEKHRPFGIISSST
jgi:two-component system sensor histidine kinase BarA